MPRSGAGLWRRGGSAAQPILSQGVGTGSLRYWIIALLVESIVDSAHWAVDESEFFLFPVVNQTMMKP